MDEGERKRAGTPKAWAHEAAAEGRRARAHHAVWRLPPGQGRDLGGDNGRGGAVPHELPSELLRASRRVLCACEGTRGGVALTGRGCV